MKIIGRYAMAALIFAAGFSTAMLLSTGSNHSVALAQNNPPAKTQNASPANANADKGEVDRGRYLVEEVAKCAECHTPRNERGELRADAWMKGASIWIKPVAPIPNWGMNVPALAGWPSFTEAQGERILEQGTGPEGEDLRPPMHIYHMNHSDAKAIIAYLRTLPR